MYRLVEAMCCNAQSSVQLNGSSSEHFKVILGVPQGSVLSPLLFTIVMEALSREFRVSCLWELLYANNLAILSDPLVDLKNSLAAWKTLLESHSLCVNLDKTKILVSGGEHNKISVSNPKYPCGVCTFGVGANSILCTSCDLWLHDKRSGQTDHLTENRNFVCRKCSGEIVPAAIAYYKEVNIGNDSFHVESTFKYLVDMIGQCDGCSDAVSTRITSSWKAFQQLLPTRVRLNKSRFVILDEVLNFHE